MVSIAEARQQKQSKARTMTFCYRWGMQTERHSTCCARPDSHQALMSLAQALSCVSHVGQQACLLLQSGQPFHHSSAAYYAQYLQMEPSQPPLQPFSANISADIKTAQGVTALQGRSTNSGQHRYGFACCPNMVKPKGQQSTVKIELHTAHGSLLHDAAEHGMA